MMVKLSMATIERIRQAMARLRDGKAQADKAA